jgi:hypothetical protein
MFFKFIELVYRITNNEVQISESYLKCITTKYMELFMECMETTFMASSELDLIMDHYGWREPA